ncbi:MAG: Fic family protein [Nanoarchaeota archaeon]|nr:Fic family protein [Nanoarchaeota archaeon]
MATIKKRTIGKHEYYYIEHSIRKNSKIEKKVKYIGRILPKNIEEIKKDLLSEIYKEKWYPLLDKIKKNYSKESRKTPKYAKEKEKETFMVRFTYDTQKIEGSTLTLRETANLLERGVTPGSKSLQDVKEAEAHKKVFYEMLSYKKDLSLQIVLYWHRKLFESSKPEIAGKIRQHQVAISGSKFMPPFPAEIYLLSMEFFKQHNKNKGKLHAIELAALAHLKFVTIHPFADGNGRISRLMMNFVLNKYGYPMFNIPYENRTSYYNALERSQVKEKDTIFLQWFFRKYIKEHKGFLKD